MNASKALFLLQSPVSKKGCQSMLNGKFCASVVKQDIEDSDELSIGSDSDGFDDDEDRLDAKLQVVIRDDVLIAS